MKVADLIFGVEVLSNVGAQKAEIVALTLDSREVINGSLYAALKGTQVDGHQFIDKAIELGATAILCGDMPQVLKDNVTYIQVADVSKSLGFVASNFYGNPSKLIKVVAVTGTNGKTTCTSLLYDLFTGLGHKCGLLSTVQVRVADEIYAATHTTPNAIAVQSYLRKMVDAGCDYCFMEASSHAIVQNRLSGMDVDIACFTNLSHDHLDYHNTFSEYRDAKKLLFDNLSSTAFCLSNKDDKNGAFMLQNTKASKFYYALKTSSDFKGKVIEMDIAGMLLNINKIEAWYQLTGDFNAANLLLVYGTAFLLEKTPEEIVTELTKVGRVPGRFEIIKSNNGITAIIDYAHTPDALENLLRSVNGIRTKNETLFTVFGCGGNRDKTKRPEMAKAAARLSDKVLITSDNPRDEVPEVIIDEIEAGVPVEHKQKTISITDRKQAIRTAIMMAVKGDIIVVAGKGHETYQEIKGVKHDFDDRQIVRELFNELNK
jgi:UDP-N-acetylmuramoyl-L-alanyl-D-glutamate--2,6-diaminopimelate ligase